MQIGCFCEDKKGTGKKRGQAKKGDKQKKGAGKKRGQATFFPK